MLYIIGLMCFEECAHECCSLELAIGIERQTQRERERERLCVRERDMVLDFWRAGSMHRKTRR